MKKLIITCVAIMALLTAFSNKALSQKAKAVKDTDDDDTNSGWSGGAPGTWDAVVKGDEINIQFYGKHWSNGRNFEVADFGTLPTDHVSSFTLNREAGKMSFKGVFQDHFGHGTYTFEQNAGFKTYLEQKGYKELDDQMMLDVFFTDINKGYFDFMRENGYPTISNSQFHDLAEQNLSRKVLGDYFALFKAESYGHQSIDKIVELREHGVNAKFIKSFADMGYKEHISLDKALELRDHGVHPEFITSIQKMGYGSITLDKAIELRDHGVHPEFIESIQKMGYGKLTLDEAEDLRDHGVTPDFINEIQKMGYGKLALDEARELRDHGVNADFIKNIKALGFSNLTLAQAQELRDHGVSAEFIKKTRNKGIKVETLDDFIKLRDTGFSD